MFGINCIFCYPFSALSFFSKSTEKPQNVTRWIDLVSNVHGIKKPEKINDKKIDIYSSGEIQKPKMFPQNPALKMRKCN